MSFPRISPGMSASVIECEGGFSNGDFSPKRVSGAAKLKTVAAGTIIADRPPHRSARALSKYPPAVGYQTLVWYPTAGGCPF